MIYLYYEWWFSIAMLVYQRVIILINLDCIMVWYMTAIEPWIIDALVHWLIWGLSLPNLLRIMITHSRETYQPTSISWDNGILIGSTGNIIGIVELSLQCLHLILDGNITKHHWTAVCVCVRFKIRLWCSVRSSPRVCNHQRYTMEFPRRSCAREEVSKIGRARGGAEALVRALMT